ncbi:MAG: hypothetical protein DRM99_06070 [Thermoplasmata archaeon]|nr:MAG: hypothetical protein DRM99_06070 [Thermoplasmata archaeon]
MHVEFMFVQFNDLCEKVDQNVFVKENHPCGLCQGCLYENICDLNIPSLEKEAHERQIMYDIPCTEEYLDDETDLIFY